MSGWDLPGAAVAPGVVESPAIPGGVLHGALSRPPRMLWDGKRYGGARLQDIDMSGAQMLPGVVKVVRISHFVGVVAVSAISARQALEGLRLRWQSPLPSNGRDAAMAPWAPDAEADDAAYVWQIAEHSETQGQGVTAWCTDSHATVWSSCVASYREVLRAELSALLDLPVDRIEVVDIDREGARDSHMLDVLDAAADAVLLSRAVGQPVQVLMQSAPEPGDMALRREPLAADADDAAHANIDAPSIGDVGQASYWISSHPWGLRPSLARLLSQPVQAMPVATSQVQGAGAITPAMPGMALPLAQASIGELEAMQVFAQETALDEEAERLGIDPMVHRLARLPDGPGRALTERLAQESNWAALASHGTTSESFLAGAASVSVPASTGTASQSTASTHAPAIRARPAGAPLRGRGFATAHVRDAQANGAATDTWSAWVVEVEVAPDTGHVDVTRLVVGRDSQSMQPARAAAIHDQDPQLLDAARRLLNAPAQFDDWGARTGGKPAAASDATSREVAPSWGDADRHAPLAQPIDQGRLALDGVMTLPAAAAIGNAIFDATGVRLRQVPFNVEQLRGELAESAGTTRAPVRSWWRRGGLWLAAGASAAAGLITMAWPLKPAIAPTSGPDVSLYSAAAIERGRLVAAAGDCVVCHTAPDGKENAGGLGLDTPFGTIYTTNITPDNETGIGLWSYRAFERAMREGVHRDGRQLYPAFPYTAFAKMTDADMQALYAYLMVQPPVRSEPPKTALPFPYNVRPMMAGWNMLFHDTSVYEPDPAQSLAWNRGAYLVEGAGHCSACHSPRNALGGEKTGVRHYLAGGEAEGWEAPPLNQLATGKVPWTPDALFQYLRTGYAASHGVAAGPMAPVIHGLAALPESDVRAMVTYLFNLPGSPAAKPGTNAAMDALAAQPVEPDMQAGAAPIAAAAQRVFEGRAQGERIYQNACAVCHEAAAGPTLFGVKPLLATNTNLHAATPDNLVQVILHGIQAPANDDLGYMPGFKDSLDDEQVQHLLSYLRERFAPQEPQWADSSKVIDRIRHQAH